MRLRPLVAIAAAAAVAVPGIAIASSNGHNSAKTDPSSPLAVAREWEPVVLTGAQFGDWAVPANQTAKAPLTDFVKCPPGSNTDNCPHNNYSPPDVDTATVQSAILPGTPVNDFTGWAWNPNAMDPVTHTKGKFVQIPFQIDQMFVRYLDNSASGFAIYSGDDQHLAPAFDTEWFHWTADPNNPCIALPGAAAQDPIPGFDTNDEASFMANDAGPQAPSGAALPAGVVGMKQVAVTDPTTGSTSYVYVMKSANGTPSPSNVTPYVHYQRDANANVLVFSESSYSNYGNAPKGEYCTPDGKLVTNPDGTPKIGRRRPLDTAWVTTPRYQFRYDGRWLMTQLKISPDNGATYGANVVDRWKARAFQQDPSSHTPCCGFEEEDTHWGGSSALMGERCGPVRCIRETWGADSGTNVVRREIFYRDSMTQVSFLRVHVIPPLDGIYAQWDYSAGRMTKFYNPEHPSGVDIDGRNDETMGNLDDPCNTNYDAGSSTATDQSSTIDQSYRSVYKQIGLCPGSKLLGVAPNPDPYHQSVDITDPTFNAPGATLDWTETAGPNGSIVDRWSAKVDQTTPGGAVQSVFAVPYYRDDSCFDDGTGNDPGPRLNPGDANEPRTYVDTTTGTIQPRKCWTPADGIPAPGDAQYYQGDIGTHGLHLLFLVESDNARQTVPIDEIVSQDNQVFLPGNPGNVGEQYGRSFEKPLVAVVLP